MDDLIESARVFAIKHHGDQKRKYTDEPYWFHLAGVADLVGVASDSEVVRAAAWLHDVVEDTPVSLLDVIDEFGPDVGELVFWLTDSSTQKDGKRKRRKAVDRYRLGWAPAAAQTIKLADLIDNTSSIVEHDPGFARVYLSEKADLLEVLQRGDAGLFDHAARILRDGIISVR